MCLEQPEFATLQQVWEHASKMRNWLQAKKSSVTNKFKILIDEVERDMQEDAHLEEIYKRVIEKAEFLIKLEPPKSM